MSAEAEFATALAAFQAELPTVSKDQTARAGSYSYSFADLTKITEAALPLLARHGLSWTAMPTLVPDLGFVLHCSLLHVGGHREDGNYPLPDQSKHSAQEIGSALTYARRYALCAATGIAPGGEDDDGHAAAQARSAPRQQPVSNGNGEVSPARTAKARVWAAAQARGWTADDIRVDYAATYDDKALDAASVAELEAYAKLLEAGTVTA